jgi:hypothetical protein
VQARRLDGENVDRLAERAGRMDHRAIDPGRGHLGQRIIDRIGRDLAMVRAHLAVLPDVDLGIDDQHGVLRMIRVTTRRDPVVAFAGYSIGMKIEWRILPST